MSSALTEDRLGELLLRWDELRRQGRELSAGELCADCPELAAELGRRIEVVRGLEPVLDVEPSHLAATPGDGGPDGSGPDRRLPDDLRATTVYRPRRYHAQGGLGEVLAAHQEELDRTVALKRVRPDRLHDTARRRFLREAAITARLQHPGIVPIYGLGQDRDGPFYTMPFIEGRTLQEAIDALHGDESLRRDPGRRGLKFRGLLQQFIAVCNTMAYAHDRRVIHRDLKPSNIMLGPYGETLVMDWGLAKRLGTDDAGVEVDEDAPSPSPSHDALTATGAVLGTLYYMSPEQARGEPTSPASDVFSLGLILYAILTGKSPYADAVPQGGDIQEAVRRAAVVPPRRRDRSLPDALEAICLKVLALRPEDRYSSPRALADDLSKWLADEPVSAYREPWTILAQRWTRKHRTVVTAAAAALVVAAVGLGAITAVQTKARNDLAAKNRDLTAANNALDEQRRRAEDRETRAIEAVMKFRDAVANEPELKNTPALDGLRKRLLKEPLSFFLVLRDRLQADRDTRPESLARLAEASFNLGALAYQIGDRQDALAAYRESLAVRRKLADADPAVDQFQNDLAASYNNIGMILRETGRPAEAMEAHESALAIRRKLADANPAVDRFQSDLARSHSFIGDLLFEARPAEAMAAYESALAIRRKLADANPAVDRFQSDLAASYLSIGNLLAATGRPAEAMKSHESALVIRRKLAVANPAVNLFQRELSASLTNIGALLCETGKPGEALKVCESASAIKQRLVQANPTNTQFQSDLALSHHNLGILLNDIGKTTEGLKALESALAIRRRLAEANPAVTWLQSELAATHYNIGEVLRTDGKPADASKAFESALEIYQKLAGEHPESADCANSLGGTLNGLALVDLEAERYQEARVRLREALEWQRKALTTCPTNPTFRRFLAASLTNMIRASRGLGDSEGAAAAERELAKVRDSDPAMVALDARLSAILRRNRRPVDNRERLQLAQRAYDKALYTAAAKLWADALDADPGLAEDRRAQHRYNAACAAALSASGKTKDGPSPDEAAKAKLRKQALGWLRTELLSWSKLLDDGSPRARKVIQQALAHWKVDTDLAGIRDESDLAELPEAARKDWQALWADVDALLRKAGS